MKKLSTATRLLLVSFIATVTVLTTYAQQPILPPQPSILAGELPVTYDVSANGSFTYSLPLEIPPGIHDLVPSLSISYNSQGGNGNLGMGWSLSGASLITRTGTSIFHNNQLDPVDFDNNDVFVLDGQRLIPVGTNTYMTEIKNFCTITSSGTAGNGPQSFTVEHPDGTVYEYGTTAQSRLILQGKQDVLIWGLNRITDKNGNYIDFTYYNSQSEGVLRLLSIKYTGNTNSPVDMNTIHFTYLPRYVDKNKSWVAGALMQDSVYLSQVEVYHTDSSSALFYRLGYDYTFYTHLVEITEIRPGMVALPPIKIKWGEKGRDTSVHANLQNYTPTTTIWRYTMGDYNADGATDIVRMPDGPYIPELFISDKNYGFIDSGHVAQGGANFYSCQQNGTVPSQLSMDYNGDGYDDVIFIEKYQHPTQYYWGLRMHLYLAKPGGGFDPDWVILDYSNSSSSMGGYYVNQSKVLPGDFDGDGRRDFMVIIPYDLTGYNEGQMFHCFLVGYAYQNGPNVGQLGNYGALTPGGHYRLLGQIDHEIYASVPMDFDGDGKTDLLITNDAMNTPQPDYDCEIYTVNANYSNGAVIDPTSSPAGISMIYTDNYPSNYTRVQGAYNHIYAGDFNGDGKDDVLTWEPIVNTPGWPGIWKILYSRGVGSLWETVDISSGSLPLQANELSATGPWYFYNYSFNIGDFNGDGKDDILQIQDSANHYCAHCGPPSANMNNVYKIYYSSGMNFTKETGKLPDDFYTNRDFVYLGDYDGDGQIDILNSNSWSDTPVVVYFHKNDQSHLVTAVETAGKRLDISYKSLGEKDAPYSFVPWSVNGHTQTEYPYISKAVAIKVVTGMKDNISMKKNFEYQTLSINENGLGLQGFHEVRTNDSSDPARPKLIKNQYSLFPALWGTQGGYGRTPVLCTTSIYVINDLGALEQSYSKLYSYIDEDGGAGGKVRLFMNYGTIETNFATGEYTDIIKDFHPLTAGTPCYEFGQPTYTETAKATRNGYIYDRSTYTYDMNAAFHNRSKPVSVVRQVTYPGKPSYSRTINYEYNSVGLVYKKTSDPGTANEAVHTYLYDSFGNMWSDVLTAPNASPSLPSIVKNWDFTADHRFVKRSREYHWADAYNDENVSFNKWGKVTEYKDRTGLSTLYEYDSLNRVVKTEYPDGVIERTAYKWAYDNATDNPASAFYDYKVITANQGAAQLLVQHTTDGISGAKYEFFDFYKRKIRETHPGYDGQTIYADMAYDNAGYKTSSTSPYPASNPSAAVTTTYSYDYFGREIWHGTSMGDNVSTSYAVTITPTVLTTTMTTSGGSTKVTYSDAQGVYKTIDNNVPIETFYNSNGSPNEVVINGNQNLKTSYQYDSYGRVISKTEPNTGTTTYTYNAYDQLMSKTDNLGITYEYTYDVLGRLSTKTQSGQPTGYTYTYYNTANLPSTGKVMEETSPYSTSKHYTYDAYGRLDSLYETVPGQSPFINHYTYDSKGRIDTRTYPSGYVIQNSYNGYGYHSGIDLVGGTANPHSLWQAVSEDHLGNLTQAYLFDQAGSQLYTVDRSYDALGFETSRSVTHINSTVLSSFQTNFDIHTGNLQDRTDKYNHSENFTYDSHERLTNINGAGTPVTVEYTDEGNIKRKDNVTNSVYNWKYDKYALVQVPEPQNSMPAWMLPQADQEVTYYPFKKIQNVTEQGYRVGFLYGPDDERCRAMYLDMVNHTTLQQKYYASGYEKTINGTTGDEEELSYVTAGGELIAILRKETTASGTTDGVYYIATDHLGSITEVLDDEGINNNGLVEERSYDAWGRPRDVMSFMPQQPNVPPGWMFDRGYTGHEHIWLKGQFDFGIINMNGRLYDPVTGRMFSPDPELSDGSISECYNKYAYANNNPLKYTDPSGNNIPLLVAGAIFGGFSNLVFNAGNVHSWGDAFMYFGIGAGATLAGGGLGRIASTTISAGGFIGGASVGASAGFAGGFVGGFGNGLASGGEVGQSFRSGLVGGGMGALFGGIMAGVEEGVNASTSGRNFWNGRINKGVFMKIHNLTGKPYKNGVANQQTLDEFQKQYDPNYYTDCPGCKASVSHDMADKDAGLTSPTDGEWARAQSAKTFINSKMFKSDYDLYRTWFHEKGHALQILNGDAARIYQQCNGDVGLMKIKMEIIMRKFMIQMELGLGMRAGAADDEDWLKIYENALKKY